MTVLEKYRQKSEAARAAAEGAWEELVIKLATDAKVSDKEITAALESTGRGEDDLERDVAKEKKRIDLWEIAKGYPAALQQLRTAKNAAAEFNQRLQQTNQDLVAEGQKFQGDILAAQGQLGDINAAIRELEELTGEAVVWPGAEDGDDCDE